MNDPFIRQASPIGAVRDGKDVPATPIRRAKLNCFSIMGNDSEQPQSVWAQITVPIVLSTLAWAAIFGAYGYLAS